MTRHVRGAHSDRPAPTTTAAPRGPARPRSDRGSATILAVGVTGGLATVLVAALLLVSVLVAGQHARTAADLAALAGAGQSVLGVGTARVCAVVDDVAHRNGARVTSCELRPEALTPWSGVSVTVARQVAGTPWTVTARAAAGAARSGPVTTGSTDP
jgi:secretion/DNA translocation related TadE-like protein